MAKGIITLRNTGGGGISSVPARIICDTTNLQTTDAVRVQSMTNPTSVETVDVVTPGEYLIFDVDGRDYYKISLVQEIDNEDVEIVSVYRTLGFGEATVVNVFDKTHLSGIQTILNNHQQSNLLNIGDEVTITVAGSEWTMQIGDINHYGSNDVVFVSKHIWAVMAACSNQEYYYDTTPLVAKVRTFYNGMIEEEKALVKAIQKPQHTSAYQSSSWSSFTDYVWVPNVWEMVGNSGQIGQYYGTCPIALSQLDIFKTIANRVKMYNNVSTPWWNCDGAANGYGGGSFTIINAEGVASSASGKGQTYGVVPCFILTADI